MADNLVIDLFEPDIATQHIYTGVDCFHRNDFESALVEFDMSLAIDENPYARFNRALTLLSLGRYEGFRDWRLCWQIYRCELSERAKQWYFQEKRPIWRGEPDVPLILLHEAGFGDGIQLMRLVPLVQEINPNVVLDMPAPLQRLASQLAPLADDDSEGMICPMFELMNVLQQDVTTIPPPPYLAPDPILREKWTRRIGNGGRRRIGITWSVKLGSGHEHPAARREIPLDQFLELLPIDGQLYSLQTQEREKATLHGIWADTLDDFADVAALASLMDTIISIDTAALHVAGAIGHQNTFALLPYAATWRWLHGNWYPEMKLCRQKSPADWASAFADVVGSDSRSCIPLAAASAAKAV